MPLGGAKGEAQPLPMFILCCGFLPSLGCGRPFWQDRDIYDPKQNYMLRPSWIVTPGSVTVWNTQIRSPAHG